MHDFQVIDSILDINKISSYHLSIQAGPDGFAFTILDPYHNKYVALANYPFEKDVSRDKLPDRFTENLKRSKYLNGEYNSITCIFLSQKSTLLPSALFDKNKLKMYFEFNHILDDLDELHANYLKHLDAYLIFPIYSEIANVLVKKFPKISFFSQSTPLIENLLIKTTDQKSVVALNFQHNFFDIAVKYDNSLKLHNCFPYRSPEDLIYFILYVFDKIRLDTEHIPVMITGDIDEKSSHIKIIKKFIKQVEFGKPQTQFEYSHLLHKYPSYHFANLLNLYHCV